MSHLDILLPFGLLPPAMAPDLLKELKLPALSILTARAASGRNASHQETFEDFHRALPHEIWLMRSFGLEQVLHDNGSPPVAIALMREFGIAIDAGRWFILQPVHIHIARDHLVLTDPRQLMLTESQSRVLFDIAKPLFEEIGMTLLYGNTNTWFVRADDWDGLQTSTPDTASGHNIDIWMPNGPPERAWRKIQNEVQMHWFNHPVNEEREAHRLKPVNSLWLWGGASAGEAVSGPYTDAFQLSGWMQALGQFVPRHSPAGRVEDVLAKTPQHALVVLDSLIEPALANDWATWLARMHIVETTWFAPLLDALRHGTIDSLSLILTDDARLSRITVTRSSLRKFWVKPSLAALNP